jgi:hypothetical protein
VVLVASRVASDSKFEVLIRLCLDRIEDAQDMGIRWYITYAEEGLDIVPAGRQHKIPLEAASCIESFVLFPGFRPSGKARKVVEIRSTRRWAFLGVAFGVVVGIRRVSEECPCPKNAGNDAMCSVIYTCKYK